MPEIDWVPSLVVVVAGTLAGLALAWRQGRPAAESAVQAAAIEDLRRAKERLLQALRDLEDLGRGDVAAERTRLELEAAGVIRALQEAEGAADETRKRAEHGSGGNGGHEARPAKAGPRGGAGSELRGMIKGGVVVAFVALAGFAVTRGSGPRHEDAGAVAARDAAGRAADGADAPAHDLSPDQTPRLEAARSALAASPGSLDAQVELGYALVAAEGWMEAYSTSQEILRLQPGNPDGSVIQGVVRLAMGMDQAAAVLFAQALSTDPGHGPALSYSGLVALRAGDREAARAAWTRALQTADAGDRETLTDLLAQLDDPAPIPGLEPTGLPPGHPDMGSGEPPGHPAPGGAEAGGGTGE